MPEEFEYRTFWRGHRQHTVIINSKTKQIVSYVDDLLGHYIEDIGAEPCLGLSDLIKIADKVADKIYEEYSLPIGKFVYHYMRNGKGETVILNDGDENISEAKSCLYFNLPALFGFPCNHVVWIAARIHQSSSRLSELWIEPQDSEQLRYALVMEGMELRDSLYELFENHLKILTFKGQKSKQKNTISEMMIKVMMRAKPIDKGRNKGAQTNVDKSNECDRKIYSVITYLLNHTQNYTLNQLVEAVIVECETRYKGQRGYGKTKIKNVISQNGGIKGVRETAKKIAIN